jgi:hypothetical protein
LAYYGPDQSRAAKAVVSIILSAEATDLSAVRKWHSDTADVRTDPVIIQEILTFMEQHQVQRVTMRDRMLGCPHEEGVDYPVGDDCPHCPYWLNRDRWTGEEIS